MDCKQLLQVTTSVSDPFHFDPSIWILLRIRPKIEKNTNSLFTFFFYQKYISSKTLFCYLCPLIKSLIFSRKKCLIFLWFWLIFVEIFHDFGRFFASRIQTDPNPIQWLQQLVICPEENRKKKWQSTGWFSSLSEIVYFSTHHL